MSDEDDRSFTQRWTDVINQIPLDTSEPKRLVLTHDPDSGCQGCVFVKWANGTVCAIDNKVIWQDDDIDQYQESAPDFCRLRSGTVEVRGG